MLREELTSAVRSLVKHPGFSAVVIITMMLCIGGNTAIFSAANAVVFRTLPYQDAERLVVVSETYLPSGGTDGYSPSYPITRDWRQQNRVFDEISPFLHWRHRTLIGGDSPERLRVNYVPSEYFSLLGVRAQRGRLFSPEEADTPPGERVAVISHDLWQRRFQGDDGILGKPLVLDGGTYLIIGVMPDGFADVPLPGESHLERDALHVWLPVATVGDAFDPTIFEDYRFRIWSGALAKLKPGVTLAAAQEQMDAVARRTQQMYPESNQDYGVTVVPLSDYVFADLGDSLLMLLAGAVFVLLIGCANVMNLLLVRATARRREIALRLALGAGKAHLTRQLLLEHMLLALIGGGLGMLLAVWGTRLLRAYLDVQPPVRIAVDGQVLLASLAVTVLVGILFGLPPALSAARVQLSDPLQGRDSSGSTPGMGWSRKVLVIIEVATAVILLIGASLMIESFRRLNGTGLSLDADRLLTVRLELQPTERTEPEELNVLTGDILENVQAVPGVAAAALWGPGMPGFTARYAEIAREGQDPDRERIQVDLHQVTPGALKTLGIPLLRGRDFNSADTLDAPRVAIISESLARTFWPGQDPLGKRFRGSSQSPWTTVIGVYSGENLRSRLAQASGEGIIHSVVVSSSQLQENRLVLLIRTEGSPTAIVPLLRRAIYQADPRIPLYDIATMEERKSTEEADLRLNATLMGIYAVLALALAILGIYAVLAYTVARRTQEIGIRMALGAQHRDVFRMVLRQGVTLVLIGLVIGVAGALATTRLLASLLFNVSPTDPSTFVAIAVVFTAVALLATCIPARRALRVDPILALRYE